MAIQGVPLKEKALGVSHQVQCSGTMRELMYFSDGPGEAGIQKVLSPATRCKVSTWAQGSSYPRA